MDIVKSFKGGIDDIKRESGVVTIAISSFDVEDYAGDVIRRGAFASSFADMSRLKHCVDHYHDLDHVVGTPIKGWETDQYALVESALILGTSRGHDIFEYYKHCADNGAQVEHSFCFRIVKRNPNTEIKGDDIADLQMVREYSTVIAGCNPFTPLVDLKGITTIQQLTEYQDYLTELLRKCDFTDAGGTQIEALIKSIEGTMRAIPQTHREPTPAEVVEALKRELKL